MRFLTSVVCYADPVRSPRPTATIYLYNQSSQKDIVIHYKIRSNAGQHFHVQMRFLQQPNCGTNFLVVTICQVRPVVGNLATAQTSSVEGAWLFDHKMFILLSSRLSSVSLVLAIPQFRCAKTSAKICSCLLLTGELPWKSQTGSRLAQHRDGICICRNVLSEWTLFVSFRYHFQILFVELGKGVKLSKDCWSTSRTKLRMISVIFGESLIARFPSHEGWQKLPAWDVHRLDLVTQVNQIHRLPNRARNFHDRFRHPVSLTILTWNVRRDSH